MSLATQVCELGQYSPKFALSCRLALAQAPAFRDANISCLLDRLSHTIVTQRLSII